MEITVTHTLHPEVLQFFSNLFAGNTPNAKKVNGSKKETAVKEIAAATSAEPVQTQTATPSVAPAATVSLEQVRSLVQQKAQDGKRDEIKKVLADFGADKVTSLQESQYADFHAKIAAL